MANPLSSAVRRLPLVPVVPSCKIPPRLPLLLSLCPSSATSLTPSVIRLPRLSRVFAANPPAERAQDYGDNAGVSVIAEHPGSSVTSVVKNSESDSVSSVFSVGTLPTVFTTDHTDTIRINPPQPPCLKSHPFPIRG